MEDLTIAGGSWESELPDLPKRPNHEFMMPRPWQSEAYGKLKSKMFRWVVAPPGSGKTTLMSMLAYNDVMANGIEKIIIIVPQNSIKLNYEKIAVCVDGKNVKLSPLIVENGNVARLKQFLKDDLSNSKINARVLVCTHQSMCRINKKLLTGNVAIWVDEAHHLSDDENDDESTNKLGSRIAYAINNCASVNIATATPARHDRSTLISIINRKKFTEYTYTTDRHIKENTEIEDMRYNVVKYDDSPTECITRLYERSKEPTLIYLPSIRSLGSSYDENCKYEFTKKLAKAISPKHQLIVTKYGWEINGLVIVNLVDEECRKEKLELIATGEIDTIITLEMFKEGDDCPKLSRIIKVGIRKSLVVNGQMDGRLFRHYEGKKKIEIYQVIPNNSASKDEVNKFISMMVWSIVNIELIIGQPTIVMDKKKYKTGTIWEDHFGEQSINIRADLISDILKFDDFKSSKSYIDKWCENSGIETQDRTKIIASVLSYMASNTKAFNKLNNVIDLDLINQDDLFGWYSQAIGHDYLCALRNFDGARKELLELSKLKGPKPHSKNDCKHYTTFKTYCREGKPKYDSIFTIKVEANCPHWFPDGIDAKDDLLKLSELKGPIPTMKDNQREYSAFNSYCIEGKPKHDQILTDKVKANCPHWFPDVPLRCNAKERLLKLSELKGPRPTDKHDPKNYGQFIKYCIEGKPHYDSILTSNVEFNCPHWFKQSA